jgi:hypothetical protein
MVDRTHTEPSLIDLVQELRRTVGLFDGARVIVAAARAVVEAPDILWCEEHGRAASISGCPNRTYSPCQTVRVFLVPAEEES